MSIKLTYSGKIVQYQNPDPEQICLTDIAHHLSLLCRYTGAVRRFYSVAEHCCRMAFEPKFANINTAWLLMHDAAEAYLGDVATPLKRLLPTYEKTERDFLWIIAEKYGLSECFHNHPDVKEADLIMRATEVRDLTDWGSLPDHPDPLLGVIYPWPSRYAEEKFLQIAKCCGLCD